MLTYIILNAIDTTPDWFLLAAGLITVGTIVLGVVLWKTKSVD